MNAKCLPPHNQALSAVLFLYREVLGIDLPWLNNIGRPQQIKRIPSVLTKDEVAGLLAWMDGITALLARLLYGTGMRLMEGMRLRVKDVDFERHAVIVREAKGNKDRVVMLPRSFAPALRVPMRATRAEPTGQPPPLTPNCATPARPPTPAPGRAPACRWSGADDSGARPPPRGVRSKSARRCPGTAASA